ncbi:hypothetical protein HBA53_23265 (plasmid) [Rhodococcus pyridinivorans]|uniref:hypothetical protein n=1 Tax=Rhodococcus TaxID=1827 RepID=UPI00110ECF5C|nr:MULTISPECIES: hypothetical protein [Rhodococcus]MBX4171229.1 hypothetical protein [Rhodococcus sp. DMU2021]QXF84041.1 hypothetical protein HBA53_23265 [Rhodococcus pyridinivorans]
MIVRLSGNSLIQMGADGIDLGRGGVELDRVERFTEQDRTDKTPIFIQMLTSCALRGRMLSNNISMRGMSIRIR